ncbi:MAG: cytidine deaminase [Planctomycetota bacterium]
MKISPDDLLRAAHAARAAAYAPHSNYAVGAALLARDGTIHTGCNVENASYGLTICAERTAIFSAVAAGQREFVALAVVTSDGATPCGACRQVLIEFAAELPIYLGDAKGRYRTSRLSALLPDAFSTRTLAKHGATAASTPRPRTVRRKKPRGRAGD